MSTFLTVLGMIIVVAIGIASLAVAIVAWCSYGPGTPRERWLWKHRILLTAQFFLVVPLLATGVVAIGLGIQDNARHCAAGTRYVETHSPQVVSAGKTMVVTDNVEWWCVAA